MLPRLSEPFHTGHKIEGSKNTLLIKTYTSLHYYFFKPSKNHLEVVDKSLWLVQALPTQWPGDLSSRFQTKRSLKITFHCSSKQMRAGSVKWLYHSPLFLGRAHTRGCKRMKAKAREGAHQRGDSPQAVMTDFWSQLRSKTKETALQWSYWIHAQQCLSQQATHSVEGCMDSCK